MKTIEYNYRSGKEIIPPEIAQGVISVINSLDYSLSKYEIKNFKDDLSDRLKSQGWSDKASLSVKSNITITAILMEFYNKHLERQRRDRDAR